MKYYSINCVHVLNGVYFQEKIEDHRSKMVNSCKLLNLLNLKSSHVTLINYLLTSKFSFEKKSSKHHVIIFIF